MPTVLIAPEPLRGQPGAFREALREAGFTLIDAEGSSLLTSDELRPILPRIDAQIAGSERMTDDLLALAPRLRVIARTGVGYDAIDVPAATRRGVAVAITPGANHGSVAEQAFALLLGLTRNLVGNDRTIRVGGWDRTLLEPLRERTLGLVGLGRIGRAMAVRALAFEMNVVAFDPLPASEFERQHGIPRLGFEELLAASDVVSLHLPLTPATRGLFGREVLARMRPGSYLINTSRGGLVVEPDLVEALRSGHLAGAGLDVLDPEPPLPENPLFALPNAIFSPHMGGIDKRAMADMALMAARTVIELYQGGWPAERIVNPEIGPGWHW